MRMSGALPPSLHTHTHPHTQEHDITDVRGKIMDAYESRFWGIRLAADAAMNILRVDQIIMAKPAGGPNPNAAKQMGAGGGR